MAHGTESDLPVISDLSQFDYQSGAFLERLVFNNRAVVVIMCVLVTLILGFPICMWLFLMIFRLLSKSVLKFYGQKSMRLVRMSVVLILVLVVMTLMVHLSFYLTGKMFFLVVINLLIS